MLSTSSVKILHVDGENRKAESLMGLGAYTFATLPEFMCEMRIFCALMCSNV